MCLHCGNTHMYLHEERRSIRLQRDTQCPSIAYTALLRCLDLSCAGLPPGLKDLRVLGGLLIVWIESPQLPVQYVLWSMWCLQSTLHLAKRLLLASIWHWQSGVIPIPTGAVVLVRPGVPAWLLRPWPLLRRSARRCLVLWSRPRVSINTWGPHLRIHMPCWGPGIA